MDTTPWPGLVRRGDRTIKKLKAQGRIYKCVVTTKNVYDIKERSAVPTGAVTIV